MKTLTHEEIRSEIIALRRLVARNAKLSDIEDGIDSYSWLLNHISEQKDEATAAERRKYESEISELHAIRPRLIRRYETFVLNARYA